VARPEQARDDVGQALKDAAAAPSRPAAAPSRPPHEPYAMAAALDAVIHERRRLAIVVALAAHDALTFTNLKHLLGLTDGNLSVHARRLEEAGYVSATKVAEGRVPHTEFRLTPAGRKVLERYLESMETIVRTARQAPP
jgi:DNA-binding HxlR family transcriptional regulator